MTRVVRNKLLWNKWYVVRGAHQTPLAGPFDTRAEAVAWRTREPKRVYRLRMFIDGAWRTVTITPPDA